ncbi:hypothetical protein [Microbacterium sp. A1-JK]|uniref:hypothetical protein n=1 Tax=Microbacterium sp. A1-JK TaxID=3177516 RepID=UPI003885665C
MTKVAKIRNDETVEPGTLVRSAKGAIVYQVLETRKHRFLEGRLRDTRTGRSRGWEYLDLMIRCTADGAPVTTTAGE